MQTKDLFNVPTIHAIFSFIIEFKDLFQDFIKVESNENPVSI